MGDGDLVLNASTHTRAISAVILQEEKLARKRFSWLAWQDTLGSVWFVSSLLLVALSSILYLHNIFPWWATICLNGIAISILHELEHDLIHNIYFKTKPYVQNVMFFVIWFSKLHVNPWIRKPLHLRHHKTSGQIQDIEERTLGLGLPFGLKRMALTVHPFASILQFDTLLKETSLPLSQFYKQILYTGPSIVIFAVVFIPFTLYLFSDNIYPLQFLSHFPLATFPILRDSMVVWVWPNICRNICLLLMTTSCHYYGDIPKGSVYYQNQIMNHPLLWPFQIFCFNFASTHIIHHFVPSQPFYLRQMIAKPVHDEMVRQGVRKNDFGGIFRSNSFKRSKEDNSKEVMTFVAFSLLCVVGGIVVVPVMNFTLLFTVTSFMIRHLSSIIRTTSVKTV